MKRKVFKVLLFIISFILFSSNVFAIKYYTDPESTEENIVPDFSYVIGHHMFSLDFPTTDYYNGAITTPIVMLGSSSIETNDITNLDQLIIYLNLGDNDWVDSKSKNPQLLTNVPEYFDIYYINGLCVDPLCMTGSGGYRTVTFKYKNQSGTNVSVPRQVKYGEKIPASAVPDLEYRPGYEFKYWTLENSDAEFDLETPITNDIILEVAWNPITYTVTYDLNGGSSVSATGGQCNLAYFDNKDCITPAAPTRTGYTFKGWSLTSSNSTNVDLLAAGSSIEPILAAVDDTNITLHAIWEVKYHTISYHLNGGNDTVGAITGTLPGKYKYDETVTFGRPERTGYTFDGWYTNSSLTGNEITSTAGKDVDLDLYAKWTAHSFDIKYVMNNTQYGELQPCTYNHCTVETPDPTTGGFEYWVGDDNLVYKAGSKINTLNDQIVLTAFLAGGEGNANRHSINLILNDDTAHPASFGGNPIRSYIEGVGANLPTPTRDGYRFDGWFKNNTGNAVYNVGITETTDLSYTAHWTKINKAITYYYHNGSNNGSFTCNLYDASCAAPAAPTRTGYKFLGWSLTNSATDLIAVNSNYHDIIFNNDSGLALHAIWEKIEHRINYDLKGGSFDADAVGNVSYTASLATNNGNVTLAVPTKYGYSFGGWTSAQLENITNTSAKLKSNLSNDAVVSVTAGWNSVKLDIYYDPANGGQVIHDDCYYHDCTVDVANPTNGTKQFEYWYDENHGYVFKKDDHIDGFYTVGDLTNNRLDLVAVYSGYQYKNISYNISSDYLNQNNVIKKYVPGIGANLPTPTRDGYTFNGWKTSSTSTTVFTSIPTTATTDYNNLVADWTPNTYKVHYILGDDATNGSGNATSFTSDTTSITLRRPSKIGYGFKKWTVANASGFVVENQGTNIDIVEISAHEDLVLVAEWDKNNFRIIYDLNGGNLPTGVTNPNSFTYSTTGYTTTLNEPVKNGYTFTTWELVDGTATLSGTKNKNLRIATRNDVYLRAVWSEINYSISYSLPNGVTLLGESPVSYKSTDTTVAVTKATREGYTFNKWVVTPSAAATYNSSTGNLQIREGGNITLTPDISANSVTVQYCESINAQQECVTPITGITPPSNPHYGETIELPDAYDGGLANRFVYWMTSDGRFAAAGTDLLLTGDVVIYPYYINLDKFHYITYNTNGGVFTNGSPITKFYEGDSFALSTNITNGNVDFLGWYTDPDFVNPITSVSGQTTDLVLYAKWDHEPCNLGDPEVRVVDNNTIIVSYDEVNGFPSTHYPVTIKAEYLGGFTTTHTFGPGENVAAEFEYDPGVIIHVICNNSTHDEIVLEGNDFMFFYTVTLHYTINSVEQTVPILVQKGEPIDEDTYIYTNGYGTDRYYSDFTWYLDSGHHQLYSNQGVNDSLDLYGVRN